jgi:N-hydroxyarylamine O-acetyltransferase
VDLLSAQIVNEDGGYGPEFSHPVLLVTLQERWLADVGNARWFHLPLCIDDPDAQTQPGYAYHIRQIQDDYILYQTRSEGDALPQYRFTLQPRQNADFHAMCVDRWTSPESRFTQGYICSLRTPQGRIALTNRRLVVEREGTRTERSVQSRAEFIELLGETFGPEYCALVVDFH